MLMQIIPDYGIDVAFPDVSNGVRAQQEKRLRAAMLKGTGTVS